jgi:hypothetical protein
MGAYQVSFFLFGNELFWLAYPRKKQPKFFLKIEPFQVPKRKSFSVCPLWLTYIQSVVLLGTPLGNTLGTYEDTHENMVGKLKFYASYHRDPRDHYQSNVA